MQNNIKYLIENTIGFFNPDNLGGEGRASAYKEDTINDLYANVDVVEVLSSQFNMSVPNKWQVVKNKETNKTEILLDFDTPTAIPISGKRVILQLVTQFQFKKYESSSEPYAFINNVKVKAIRRDGHGSMTLGVMQAAHDALKELDKWIKKFSKFPEIVLEYFQKSPIYKTLWVSPDEGIILSLETNEDTGFYLFDDIDDFKARLRIFLTGKVLYGENTAEENEIREKEYKEAVNKMKFFDRYLREFSSIIKNKYCKFFICEDGDPYYVCFYNTEDQINYAQSFIKKKKLPGFLYELINICGMHLLAEYDKDDDEAKYEFADHGIHMYVYDFIDKKFKQYVNTESTLEVKFYKQLKNPKTPDGCIITKLESYLLDMYNDTFNKR